MESSRRILSRIRAAYAIAPAARVAPPHRRTLALLLLVVLWGAVPRFPSRVSSKLPLDPAIHVGKLPNGITYYVRRNALPVKRVSLRLAVKAGSIDEADDQRGLAHMLEHMAFNGSAHFKPGELVAYFESVGVAFGPHVNAQTSYDDTIYMLDVPTDRAGALDHGLQAMSDFAGGMSLDDTEIDKERGVVLEEWRQRLGVGSRLQEVTDHAVYGQSKYAERLPIGTPESIQHFPYKRLRDFYRANYTPDRIAVVIVGDLDAAAAEQLIRQYFGSIPARKSAKRPVYPVPPHNDTRVAVATDPEAQSSSVSVLYTRSLQKMQTLSTYRRDLVRSLFEGMLNARLSEIARRPAAPFLAAVGWRRYTLGSNGRGVRRFCARKRGRHCQRHRGDGVAELARVRQFGFADAELDRVKKSTLAAYERAYNERDKSESPGYASELVTLFLNDVPAPGIENEYQYAKQMVPTITATETAALARELVTEKNRVVIAVAPRKAGGDAAERGLAPRCAAIGHRGESHSVARRHGGQGADGHQADARIDHRETPDSRDRGDGADDVERRRGVAEADELQERPGDLLRLREGRHAQRARGELPQRDADDRTRRRLRCRRLVAGRSRQDAVGADRQRVAQHGRLHAWCLRRGHAEGSRDGAAVDVSRLHGREPRSGCIRAPEAAAACQPRESGHESRRRLR